MSALRLALMTAVLVGSTAAVVAQDTARVRGTVLAQGTAAPAPGTPMMPNAAGESQEPNSKPGGGGQSSPTRPSASQADQAVPPNASKTDPGSTNTSQATEGAGAQPPGATAQTMPSTRDPANAREDQRIIMDHALQLNDEQRQRVAQMLANTGGPVTTGAAPQAGADLAIGNTVPSSVSMHEFPQAVVESVPDLGKYKYIRLSDKVLVIEPSNRIVVAEIKA